MRASLPALLAFGIYSLVAAAVLAQSGPANVGDTSKGKALIDGAGMTLYNFDRDTAGASNCNGVCTNTWPPFNTPADAKPSGDWTIVIRKDGSKQWAYKGKPLYTFYHDGNPGDAKGDGVNNVWHIASP